jgi:hypothetical protein
MAKCPACKTSFELVRIESVSVKSKKKKGDSWNGIAYCCPSCDVAISVTIDPISVKTDIVEEVLNGFRGVR